jgi:hypothetical protein
MYLIGKSFGADVHFGLTLLQHYLVTQRLRVGAFYIKESGNSLEPSKRFGDFTK